MITNPTPTKLIEQFLPRRAHYKPHEVADFLGVSIRHVYELIAEGAMPAKKIGRAKVIPSDRFADWYSSVNVDPFA